MKVSYTTPGRVNPGSITGPWVLIFGGVTRQGNRRARRTASLSLASGHDVVWVDGFEETYPDSGERVPLEETEGTATLVVVGTVAAENLTLAGKMRTGSRLTRNPLTRTLWKVLFRRLGTLLRARASWTVVRADIRSLATRDAPARIFYADDYAITSAWYAGRIWPRPSILPQYPEGDG